jgi:hypothetical protein
VGRRKHCRGQLTTFQQHPFLFHPVKESTMRIYGSPAVEWDAAYPFNRPCNAVPYSFPALAPSYLGGRVEWPSLIMCKTAVGLIKVQADRAMRSSTARGLIALRSKSRQELNGTQ